VCGGCAAETPGSGMGCGSSGQRGRADDKLQMFQPHSKTPANANMRVA